MILLLIIVTNPCFPNNNLPEATVDIDVYIYGIQIEAIRTLWVISTIDPCHLNHGYHELLYRYKFKSPFHIILLEFSWLHKFWIFFVTLCV